MNKIDFRKMLKIKEFKQKLRQKCLKTLTLPSFSPNFFCIYCNAINAYRLFAVKISERLFIHSFTFILITVPLYRRKFCDGHIILVIIVIVL